MQTVKPGLRSKNCMKSKFKELIQTLRNRTILKEHINSGQSSANLPIQSKQQLQTRINSILPITQTSKDHIHKFLSNDESSSNKSSEIIKRHLQDLANMNEIEQSISEDNEEDEVEQIEGCKLLVNELTDLLRPEEKLEMPKNEGRTGCIRRQRFSVNKARNQKKQPRYTKNPRINHMKKPIQIPLNRPTIKELDDVAVIKHWTNSKKITQSSTIEQIYDIFCKLIEDLKITLPEPTIKKYKNCVYFGTKPESTSHTYQGIIYYFDNKMYYGQHCYGNKHGHGVEIHFDTNTKFAGNFNRGKKSGYFFVQKERENYEGMLEHGIYQGEGKLMTEDYVYTGQFQNGKKHGFGEEYYPKTGLRLRGAFKNGQYQNIDKSKVAPDPTSEQQLKVKPQKIVAKADSYDIDFQLQRTFKRQVQGIASSSSFNIKQDYKRTDSQSLFDLLTNSSKANKYDFNTTHNDKLPKIRIQGVHTQFKQFNPQFQVEPVTNKRPYQLYNSREERSPIARRSRSINQNPPISMDRDLPLSKHRLNLPIRSGK